MLCPSCNEEWPDEVRYCGACGARMPDATVVLTPEPDPVSLGAPAVLKSTQRVALSAFAIAEASDGTAPATAAPRDPAAPAKAAPAPAAQAPVLDAPPPPAPTQLPPTLLSGAPPSSGTPVEPRDTVLPAPAKHLGDVLGEAWGLCAGRRALLGFGTLIIVLASAAAAGTVIGVAALFPLWGGLVVVGLRAGGGRPVVFDDFFAGVRCFVPLAILGAITMVSVLAGTLLFVIPGLYLATVSMYAPYLVLDRDMPPLQAWRLSRKTVHEAFEGHAVLVVILSLANIGGAVTVLGVFITLPFTFVAVGVAYGRFLGYAGGVDRLTA